MPSPLRATPSPSLPGRCPTVQPTLPDDKIAGGPSVVHANLGTDHARMHAMHMHDAVMQSVPSPTEARRRRELPSVRVARPRAASS